MQNTFVYPKFQTKRDKQRNKHNLGDNVLLFPEPFYFEILPMVSNSDNFSFQISTSKNRCGVCIIKNLIKP